MAAKAHVISTSRVKGNLDCAEIVSYAALQMMNNTILDSAENQPQQPLSVYYPVLQTVSSIAHHATISRTNTELSLVKSSQSFHFRL